MSEFYYGGQAVIEGVMMRGRRQATVVVRRRDGTLTARSEELPAAYSQGFVRLPMVRGFVVLWEMLILGTRMMLFSANVQARRETQDDIPRRVVAMMLAFSLTFAIGVFFVLPLLLARAGSRVVHGSLTANLLEGGVRLLLFLAYLAVIGQIGQMRRVFQYHGAEHKAVNAYECGAELTPESVQRFSTIHIRCGTAFLLWVLVLSILVFGALGHPPVLIGAVERIVLVPVIASVGYEVLRAGARFYGIAPVRWALQPGLWLQRLTTREPTDDQVEVAIAALRPVLAADGIVAVPAAQPAAALYRPSEAAP